MIENTLFRELLKQSTLKAGWHLANLDSRDDFVSDPVGYGDLASGLSNRLSFLIRELQYDRYRPKHLIHVDVPKSGFGVRPGNVLPIEEAALLHAIVYLLGPKLDSRLSDSVYSYRLHKDWKKRIKKGRSLFRETDNEIPFLRGKTVRRIDPFEPWYVAWPEFDEQRVSLVKKEGFTHLTKTDIAAYFENIDLAILDSLLRSLVPREPILLSLLSRILHSWTRTTSTGTSVGRGIPQGNEVSSFLGNIYLLPLDQALDKFCRNRGAIWLRYVDDVEVYSKDANTAREVISVINGALRRLHLNLQGSKTEICEGKTLIREIANADITVVSETCEKLQKIQTVYPPQNAQTTTLLRNIRPAASRYRRRLPSSVHNLNKKDVRLFMRLLTAYGLAGRPYMKAAALAALEEPPDLRTLQKCLRYLGQLPTIHHDDLIDRLIHIIQHTYAQVPYHKASILGCIRRLQPSSAKLNIVRQITDIGFNQRSDWVVRQRALELLAVLPARENTALRRAKNSLEHHHPFVRRAAMLMLLRSNVQDIREHLGILIEDPDASVSRLAVHWQCHLQRKSLAQQALARLAQRNASDQSFIWHLPTLYLLRCHENHEIVSALRTEIERFSSAKGARVQWHYRALMNATGWVTN
jgi:retron-type reverse transcriptase